MTKVSVDLSVSKGLKTTHGHGSQKVRRIKQGTVVFERLLVVETRGSA